MKKKVSLMMMIYLLLACSLYSESLTLKQSLEWAKNNYPAVLKLKKSLKAIDYRIKNKMSSFFPEVALGFSYSQKGGEYLNDSSGLVQNYKNSSYGISLNLNQTVFNRFSNYFSYKISLVERLVEENNLKQAGIELCYSMKELYFSILLFQKQIQVLKQIVERRKQNYTIAKISYDAGKEKITSVFEAEASVKQSEYELMEKNESLKLNLAVMNIMMGQNEEKAWEFEKEILPELKWTQKEMIQKAMTQSTKIKSTKQKTEIEEMSQKTYWGEYLPSLSFSAAYGYSDTQFFPRFNSWSFGLSVSVPLFSGNSTDYKIEESKNKVMAYEEEHRFVMQEIETGIKIAGKKYHMAKTKQELLNLKLKAARNSYRLTRLEYQQGKISYLWLEQKENELSSLELELGQNEYLLRIYLAELEKIMGEES